MPAEASSSSVVGARSAKRTRSGERVFDGEGGEGEQQERAHDGHAGDDTGGAGDAR